MITFFTIMYLTFCFAVFFVFDDGKKWNWEDYFILLTAPILVPILIGTYIGLKLKEHDKK